ncbi:MAG: AMP-binding protein, partial [Hyphomonas sp.]
MIDIEAMPFLADVPRVQAGIRPDEAAFWFEGETTTFRDLDRRSSQVANGLIALGLGPQDRVGYLAKNTSQYYEMLYGCAKSRTVMTAVNTRLAAPEVKFILSDAGAKILFVGKDFYDMAAQIREELPDIVQIIAIDGGHAEWPDYASWRDAQDAAPPGLRPKDEDDVLQLYTSGTTGLPKGVQLTNLNYRELFEQARQLEWSSYDPGDVVMNAMPLFHVAGVNLGILSSIQGAKAVVLREIDPQMILKLVEEQKVQHAFWVPAVILMLTQQPNVRDIDWTPLKQVFYGASPITESLLLEAQELMGARFTQLYGLTETVGAGTFLPPEAHDPAWGKLRSCGVPYPGAVIRCVDSDGNPVPTGEVGEIV